MNIPREITEWAANLPKWQQDAVRRLVVQGDLSEEDRLEILLMLKKEKGIIDPDNPAPKPQPLKESHFSISPSGGPATILRSMHSLNNVNALAPNQTIRFAEKGVTVIYGRNASGKSGYARVLLRACRARGEHEPILPDVFHCDENTPPAEAVFDVIVNGKDKSEKWTDGQPSPDFLADVQVFDSECARVYVDESNKVLYVPYGLDIFKKLADFCKKNLRVRLERELKIVSDSAQYLEQPEHEDTQVARLLSEINYETPASQVENLANLSDAENQQLDELEQVIKQLQVSSPEEIAKRLRKKKDFVQRLCNKINNAIQALSASSKLQKLYNEAQSAAEAAKLAREQAVQAELVPGTGSDPWRDMFLAAKQFSETVAYPEQGFPAIRDDQYCVLCQQLLEPEAVDRLTRFNTFIKKKTERVASQKKAAYDGECQAFRGIELHPPADDSAIISEIREMSEGVAELLQGYFEYVRKREQAVKKACTTNSWEVIHSAKPSPVSQLTDLASRFEDKAKQQDELAEPEARAKLEKEFAELSSRRWLAKRKAGVLRYLEQLQLQHRLNRCHAATRTREITLQGSEFMSRAVTESLHEALNKELEDIGVSLELELRRSGDIGDTYHQLQFIGTSYGISDLSRILSEGEHRAVAIASFLAELSISGHTCGIVFDDPVCSLDHIWIEKIARRLVREGTERQVIVFTHDIVFLVAMEEEADMLGFRIRIENILLGPDGIGICPAELDKPWLAMSTGERIDHLMKVWGKAKECYEDGDIASYEGKAALWYSQLREAWETAIEEVLLNKSILRFRADVMTQRLTEVLVEKGDTERIYRGMKKCSKWMVGHATATARDTPLPKPEELKEDIDELASFVKEIKERRKKLKKALK